MAATSQSAWHEEALIAVIALTLTCFDGHSRSGKQNRHLETGIRNIQLDAEVG